LIQRKADSLPRIHTIVTLSLDIFYQIYVWKSNFIGKTEGMTFQSTVRFLDLYHIPSQKTTKCSFYTNVASRIETSCLVYCLYSVFWLQNGRAGLLLKLSIYHSFARSGKLTLFKERPNPTLCSMLPLISKPVRHL